MNAMEETHLTIETRINGKCVGIQGIHMTRSCTTVPVTNLRFGSDCASSLPGKCFLRFISEGITKRFVTGSAQTLCQKEGKVDHKKPYRMPPPESNPVPLLGPDIESFTVGSWCLTPDGSGKPTAVAISVQIKGFGDIVIRIKSPMKLDRVVQMLLRHKRDVWPEAS